ncbi:MAG: S-layer homology domain-containing protein [Acidimicrobiia bacterium]|nr:S-layer homology domain-containing protein [Acidimicrobiia bacterium]
MADGATVPERDQVDRAGGPTGWRRPAIAVLVALAVVVAGVAGPPVAADDAAPLRYLEQVFDEVEATLDVHYRSTEDHLGNPIDLRLDIYEPAGDTETQRPLVVFMHGGWFAFGSKDTMGPVVRPYVERGYVAVAISYRTNPDNGWSSFTSIDQAMASPVFLQSVVAAYRDAEAAVAWLRERAEVLRIHPDAIVAAGHSAGGVMSLLLAYGRDVDDEGWSTHPSKVAAAMPWAGTVPTSVIQAGEPPIHVTHGTADTTVPYSAGTAVCDAALAVDNVCELLTLDGEGHSVTGLSETIIAVEAGFLVRHVLEPLGIQPTPVDPTDPTDPTDPGPPVAPDFSDVPLDHPAHAAIECMAAAGVTAGYPDGTFRPDVPVSRQAMVAFLWHINGSPSASNVHPGFSDVDRNHRFASAVAWAEASGTASGYADGTFRPTIPVSRQAAAAFTQRASGVAVPDVGDRSLPVDVARSNPFVASILWTLDWGYFDVDDDGRFDPTGPATRAAVAPALCALSSGG